MSWLIVCDFDGTIAQVDSTDELLKACAHEDWHAIEARWEAGEIDARTCMLGQVELLRPDMAAIDRLIDSIDIDPDFPAFVRECCDYSVPLAIVSDGIDYVIRRILARYDLEDIVVLANKLAPRAGGGLTLLPGFKPEYGQCGMGVCKCSAISWLRSASSSQHCVFIGDGRSDFCAAASASDAVFAKPKLAAHCAAKGAAFTPFETFSELVPRVAGYGFSPASKRQRDMEIAHAGV